MILKQTIYWHTRSTDSFFLPIVWIHMDELMAQFIWACLMVYKNRHAHLSLEEKMLNADGGNFSQIVDCLGFRTMKTWSKPNQSKYLNVI